MQLQKISLHSAGVTKVKQELESRGFKVKQVAKRESKADFLIFSKNGKTTRLKVFVTAFSYRGIGTNGEKGLSWMMNKDHINLESDDLFFCFVVLQRATTDTTRFFVVPSTVAIKYLKDSFNNWIRLDSSHDKDNTIRNFVIGAEQYSYPDSFTTPMEKEYENKWSLLNH